LFVGSWHEPNLVAMGDILGAAAGAPDLSFVVIGGASLAFEEREIPPNVDLCGIVDDGFMDSVLRLADAALNPMRIGSGTNLKMVAYALAGVPIVSSIVGARGLDLLPGVHYVPCEPDPRALVEALRALRAEDPATVATRVTAARQHALTSFAWDVIGRGLHEQPAFRALLEGALA
jgi:glycosyltransferase involved in cell wall biosynthesis